MIAQSKEIVELVRKLKKRGMKTKEISEIVGQDVRWTRKALSQVKRTFNEFTKPKPFERTYTGYERLTVPNGEVPGGSRCDVCNRWCAFDIYMDNGDILCGDCRYEKRSGRFPIYSRKT